MSLLFIQRKNSKIGKHFVKERTLLAPPGVLNAKVHHYRSAGTHFYIVSTSPTPVLPSSFTITTTYMINASQRGSENKQRTLYSILMHHNTHISLWHTLGTLFAHSGNTGAHSGHILGTLCAHSEHTLETLWAHAGTL